MIKFFKKIFDRLFTPSTYIIAREINNDWYVEGGIIKEFLTQVYFNLYKNCTEENKEQQIKLLKNYYKDVIKSSTISFLSWGAQTYEWVFNDKVLIYNSDPYKARFEPFFEKILIEWIGIQNI